jgi:predicted MFS family arabinose efflux permease
MTTAILTPGGTATPGAPAARPSLVTGPLLLRFVTLIGASVSFYLPLSVMPLFAKSSGAGATTFGMGFGLLQNATLTLMYARVPGSGHTAVSAIWNAAYDAGMGAGAIGMGLLAGSVGYPAMFLLTAALVVTALLPARGERAQSRSGR